jgi:hypothetical protein
MLNLAKRIELASRDYFLTYEEGMASHVSQTLDDRDKIWDRVQELREEKDFHKSRQQAVEEFIFEILDKHCVLIEPTEEKKTQFSTIKTPDDFDFFDSQQEIEENEPENETNSELDQNKTYSDTIICSEEFKRSQQKRKTFKALKNEWKLDEEELC